MNRTALLKNLISSDRLEFIMEAHDALSAKIVEEAGFSGIWASSLSMSAALGVRDNNEASWTQLLETLEFMSDATNIPILFDGDTGYGNFNNVRRLIKKLEMRRIAGICIEDKLFPKTNSFLRGETQPLADMDEFCGKIKAACDMRNDPDFVIVARVEAFIAGWGVGEALRRAEAYRNAGADAVLIHSKKSNCSEIEEFMQEWGGRLPVVIVPTKYYSTPTDRFRQMNVSLVIWANQTVRAAISYMQKITARIKKEETLINVEDEIVPVSEIFRLQGDDELKEAEKKYLPAAGKNVNAIILAAARGDKLGELTKDIPKTLIKINGTTILSNIINIFNESGIKDITVVRGFKKEKVSPPNVSAIDNDEHAETSELYSLWLALGAVRENTIVCYGDILFKKYVINELLNDNSDIVLIADADFEKDGNYHDYVKTSSAYSKKLFLADVELEKMSPGLSGPEINGEFIGLFRVNERGAGILKSAITSLSSRPEFKKMRMNELFNEISKNNGVMIKFIKGSWLDINTIIDLQKTGEF